MYLYYLPLVAAGNDVFSAACGVVVDLTCEELGAISPSVIWNIKMHFNFTHTHGSTHA